MPLLTTQFLQTAFRQRKEESTKCFWSNYFFSVFGSSSNPLHCSSFKFLCWWNTKHKQKQRFVAFSHPILTCMSHVRLSTNKNIENCLICWCKLNLLYKDSIGAQKAYNCEHTCYRHSLVTEVGTMQIFIALLFVITMFTLLCNVEGEELEQQKRYDW